MPAPMDPWLAQALGLNIYAGAAGAGGHLPPVQQPAAGGGMPYTGSGSGQFGAPNIPYVPPDVSGMRGLGPQQHGASGSWEQPRVVFDGGGKEPPGGDGGGSNLPGLPGGPKFQYGEFDKGPYQGLMATEMEMAGARQQQAGQMSEWAQGTFDAAKQLDEDRQQAIREARQKSDRADLLYKYAGMDEAEVDERTQRIERNQDLIEELKKGRDPSSYRNLQEVEKQLRDDQDALAKAQEVDPDRIYGRSTGRKMMAAIAVGLGAYGAALAGTPNYALQIVENAVERDIAAQRAAFEKKGREADKANNAYGRLMNIYGDPLMVELKMRELGKEVLLQNGHKTIAGLEGTQGAQRLQLMMNKAEQDQKNINNELAARQVEIGLQRTNVGINQQRLRMQTQGSAPEQYTLKDAQLVNPERIKTPQQYQQAREMNGLRRAGLAAMDKLIAWREKHAWTAKGHKLLRTAAWDEISPSHSDMLDLIRNLENYGARFEDKEMIMLANKIGEDPSDIGNLLDKLISYRSIFEEKTRNKMADFGYKVSGGGYQLKAGGAPTD